jgi:hypothetical protein
MSRLRRLQRDGRRRRKPLDDAHIVGAEAGRWIMMSDPKSAQRRAVAVEQRNDQGFDDQRLNPGQIREGSLRARQDNCRADVQTQPARAEIAGCAVSLVSSQRAAHCLPDEVRMTAAARLQDADARAAGTVEAQHTIHQALQGALRIVGTAQCQFVEGSDPRVSIRRALTGAQRLIRDEQIAR